MPSIEIALTPKGFHNKPLDNRISHALPIVMKSNSKVQNKITNVLSVLTTSSPTPKNKEEKTKFSVRNNESTTYIGSLQDEKGGTPSFFKT